LRWEAQSGSSYRVQWKHDFSDPTWNDLGDVNASGSTAQFQDTVSTDHRFYRLVNLTP
jgi:hypothetical protein